MENEMLATWLLKYGSYTLAALWLLGKIVKLTPTKYDDVSVALLVDIVKALMGKGKGKTNG